MIQFIVFSRKRPLQLYGYLESLFRHISEQVAVGVIARIDPGYEAAYAAIQERFPYVYFLEETDFHSDVKTLINRSAANYVSFGCDDVVFTGSISPDDVTETFNDMSIIGLSLRLGRNVVSGMFGNAMPLPMFTSMSTHKLAWDITHPFSVGDWAYPWEVLGTIYPMLFVRDMVYAIEFHNPSQLEAEGALAWPAVTGSRIMATYPTSRIVVPTVNVVQTEFPNGILGYASLSPEFLLDCWNNGLRLDTRAFEAHAYDSWRIPDFHLMRG